MRKALVPFLVLGLILLGMSPALAAGEQVKAAPPAQQNEVVQVVVPATDQMEDSLGDEELAEIEGEGLIGAFAGALFGMVLGALKYLAVTAWNEAHGRHTASIGGALSAIGNGALDGAITGLVFPDP